MDTNQNTKLPTMDEIVSLAKRRGFAYQNSSIYGGLANLYDYGPMGTLLLRNIRQLWWDTFVTRRDDIVGIDASIISHARVWEASGHVASFADAMLDCKECRTRTRADHLIEQYFQANDKEIKVEGKSLEELTQIIADNKIPCPTCKKHNWTEVRKFNLLFPVKLGILEETQSMAYLRGETAQGIFINFKNVLDSTRVSLPFGIAQNGRSFRNEITKGNFVFRTIEFEQGEIEYFFDPDETDWNALFEQWKTDMFEFLTQMLGVKKENLRWRTHSDEERSFYSKRTEDMEYNYPFGFSELWGLAYRTDYDLTQHEKFSKQDMKYLDPKTGKKFIPHVIEPAVGLNRIFLMILCDAFWKDEVKNRIVLKLSPQLAPYQAAVFPLVRNNEDLTAKAHDVYLGLQKKFRVIWDDRGNIGKRYLAQDEIGTPICVTIDYQTLEDQTVTIRSRDTADQIRVAIDDIGKHIL
jgi:glycyl-tRNA synthetase